MPPNANSQSQFYIISLARTLVYLEGRSNNSLDLGPSDVENHLPLVLGSDLGSRTLGVARSLERLQFQSYAGSGLPQGPFQGAIFIPLT